jgi:thioredoxin 1
VFANLSLEFPAVIFAKVDVDVARDVARHLSIRAMPTFILMKEGSVFFQFEGFSESTLREVLAKSGARPVSPAAAQDESEDDERSNLV